MKNIYRNIAWATLLVTGTSGCSGLLDDVKPDTSIPLPNVTPKELPLMAKGMYDRLSGGMYYMTSFSDDVASDNLTSIHEVANNINFKQFDDCNVSTNDGFIVARMFSFPYNGLGLANTIINIIHDKKFTDPVAKTVKGEALLMRGYCYMLLAERFGDNIISLGTPGEEMIRAKNPEAEVWQRAYDDLKEAIGLLPEFSTPNSGSIQAAKGLLARLCLNRGVLTNNNEMVAEAATYARQVIDGAGKVAMNPDFKQNFISTGTGSEVIWRLVETVSSPTSYGRYQYTMPETYPNKPGGMTWMEDNLYALYNEADDQRAGTIDVQPNSAMGKSYPYCVKFPADANPVYPFVRLAEMHLVVAEVAARNGVIDVTGYNAVRSVRNASVRQNGDFANTTVFLKEIENERRREFVMEGLRWMDMRRFKVIEAHLEARGIDTRRVHFPIWISNFDKNPLLTQTAYYN